LGGYFYGIVNNSQFVILKSTIYPFLR